jgi:serine/threonine protein phosphatase PrpC
MSETMTMTEPMSEPTNLLQSKPSHAIDITGHINQLCKGQDYIIGDKTVDCETGEIFNWTAVFDGHGGYECIDFIKNISLEKMNDFISTKNPIENLANHINKHIKKGGTGSTMCLVKFYQNRLECFNCGDSQVVVYKNGNVDFISKEHNFTNETERNRLDGIVEFVPSMNIKMVDEYNLINVYSEYIEWSSNHTRLACSQALGHNGVTGCFPDKTVIPIHANNTYKVIIGSDGLWDMVMMNNKNEMNELYCMDVDDIMIQATERWLQEWNMRDVLNNDDTVYYCKYQPYQCDDISVVVADIIPIIY